MLSLVSNPGQLLNPAHTDTIPCEYLSLERMECWIVFGFAVCHSALGQVSDIVWPSPGPTLFSANPTNPNLSSFANNAEGVNPL